MTGRKAILSLGPTAEERSAVIRTSSDSRVEGLMARTRRNSPLSGIERLSRARVSWLQLLLRKRYSPR